MPKEKLQLRPYKHPVSGIYQIRGTYLGKSVDESASTRDESVAWGVIKQREREIYEEVVLQKPRERSFAEAAIGYMKAGGEKKFLPPILSAEFRVEGKKRIFGELLLKEIDQGVIDDLALLLYPMRDTADKERAAGATRNRQVYTPVSAVLQYGANQKAWGFSKSKIVRPSADLGRVDWRTPKEIQWWLDRAGPEKAIITGYVGTGARASELVKLDWPDVTPLNHRFTLWEKDTKAGKARGLDLQMRVRGSLPQRPTNGLGPVYRNSKGERWTVLAIEKALGCITVREARAAATELEAEEIATCVHKAASKKFSADVQSQARKRAQDLYETIAARENIPWIHPHIFRHTWATWAYAVTRDLAWLMEQGGWAKPDMALRYTHVGTIDLAEDVLSYGWEIRAGRQERPLALPAPSEGAA